MKQLIFIIVVTFLMPSCKGGETPQPGNDTTPKLIWQTKLSEVAASPMSPIVYDNTVIFSLRTTEKTSPLKFLNKNTGNLEGQWNDFFDPNIGTLGAGEGRNQYQNNGKLVFAVGSRVHTIDIKTRQTLWKNRLTEAGEEIVTGLGNTIFHSKYNNINNIGHGTIYKGDILSGEWTPIFKDTVLNDFVNTLQAPIPIIDNTGDTLLYFVQTKYRFPPNEWNTRNLYCYNLTKKSLKYKTEITAPSANGETVGQPQIVGNKLILITNNKMICFDVNNGKKIWQKETNEQQKDAWTTFLIAENKVFVYAISANLVCFDLETGNQIWKFKSPNSGSFISGMQYHKGYLYYSSGGLEAFDIKTGKRVWDFSSPTKDFFNFGLRIDSDNDKIYIFDYKGNAYCYQTL
jgi:outer membrane protein assembly factor BamB